MDEPKDISTAGAAPIASAAMDAPKLTEAPAVMPPNTPLLPSITAIETPAIDLPKAASEKPSFQPIAAESVSADSIKAENVGADHVAADNIATPMFGRMRGIKPPRIGRFAQLAAAMVLASGLGAFAGALGATGYFQTKTPAPVVAAVATPADTKDVVAKLSAELTTLKAGIENTARNANSQFVKLAERFDRAEKAQAEPAAKLSRIGETLERLERRPPAAVPVASAPAPATIPAPETTGSIAEKQQPTLKPAVVEGWILRDIYDGLALVESRRGMMEVGPGSNIPGIGRVETIKKQDGRWIVVTPKGIIVSAR